MKNLLRLSGLGLALALAGCVVTSVNPFYTAKDVVFDKALLGKWGVADNSSKATVEFQKDTESSYLLVVHNEDGTEGRFVVRLFRLGKQRFFDQLPIGQKGSDYIPVHQLTRVSVEGTTMVFAGLKYEWLKNLVEAQPSAIAHSVVTERTDDGKEPTRIVLTASTAELQVFVLKNLTNAAAWDEAGTLKRLAASAEGSSASPATR